METLQYTKSVPVLAHYDVIVCGGGAAGIGVALAAAEKGAKTALIERFGFLGGMANAGYVNPMSEFAYNGRQVVGGMAWRFAQKLLENGGALVEEPRCSRWTLPPLWLRSDRRVPSYSLCKSLICPAAQIRLFLLTKHMP